MGRPLVNFKRQHSFFRTLGSGETKRGYPKGGRLMTTLIKKQRLRNNEYYDIQEVYDELYSKSLNGHKFKNLVEIITGAENIRLAYRNIKRNDGSKTAGTNKRTILDIAKDNDQMIIDYVRNRLKNYQPHTVRRKMIDKDNGKKRPLGIPTIEDRLVQQCILQVLEPICEAKFHNHSYGFRPNRSQHHAMGRVHHLINICQHHYVVDIDIKGFFDNVNHSKLLKQIWALGIRDKNLISIISKLLKAEIKGEGRPEKGTPQGGILSPLLSNIVLNELDWWLSNQWETFETRKQYASQNDRQKMQKRTKLKCFFFVRYADDFKIFCRNPKDAQKMFVATKSWLKERLGLEISPEKSKVVNLRKNYSEFLGFKIRVVEHRTKRNSHKLTTHISNKSFKKSHTRLKDAISRVGKKPSHKNIQRLNSTILGIQNYYKIATLSAIDFAQIAFQLRRTMYNNFRKIGKQKKIPTGQSKIYDKYCDHHKGKVWTIQGRVILPINAIKKKNPMNFQTNICNYTSAGRSKIHKNLKAVNQTVLRHIMENPIKNASVEYNDNRISLYVGQNGLCYVTKQPLEIGGMECHHKTPKKQGGTDAYDNLVFLSADIHKLIHATQANTISKYLYKLNLSSKDISKVNNLRKLVGHENIELSEFAA